MPLPAKIFQKKPSKLRESLCSFVSLCEIINKVILISLNRITEYEIVSPRYFFNTVLFFRYKKYLTF